jgi:1-deoxy-D-xylulose-5-phosphate reductoisomerase
VLNAANEIAVAAFLDGQIAFTRIVQCAQDVLSAALPPPPASLEEVIAVDREARIRAREVMEPVR